ncbi:MAG: dTMP kinase [Deltaproteobacteria bacterium]|nr:dTMP kinase [Deltaproteobacteria bacterium]
MTARDTTGPTRDSQGLFVVLEGIDGAGTTTQTERLVRALRARSMRAQATREPTNGPIGTMIRQVLTGRIVVADERGPRAPDWPTMALLFAADRMDHLDADILPALRAGTLVVSDRYDHSSVAYQSASAQDPSSVRWIRELNARARRPDLTIVLDVPERVASQRRAARGERAELYEQSAFLQRLAGFYRVLDQHFPGEPIAHIDGDQPEDVVHAAVVAAVEPLLQNVHK